MTTPTPELIRKLRQYDSATISNAIEQFEVRDPTAGYANRDLVCQVPEIVQPLVGYAITATADSTMPADRRPSKVDELIDLVVAAPKPAVLVIKHVGPDPKRCCLFGDMFCTILNKLDVVGLVADCSGRDRQGIRERTPDFHIFSTGWVVSHGYPMYIDFNVTVSICGLNVTPGDLLHGDHSGLLTVPAAIADQLPEQVEVVRERENDYFDFLEGDNFTLEELRRRIMPESNR